jgi:FkbM family methyltransferase
LHPRPEIALCPFFRDVFGIGAPNGRDLKDEKMNLNRVLAKISKAGILTILRGPSSFLSQCLYHFYWQRHERLKQKCGKKQSSRKICLLGKPFHLHPLLSGINEELIQYGIHEPLATTEYSKLLYDGDHVLDIGSNIGYYIFVADSIIGRKGKIIGFEPSPSNYEVLNLNSLCLDSNNNRIRLFPWAIGKNTGYAFFHESQIPNWSRLVMPSDGDCRDRITVEIKRLDDILSDFRDFHPTVLRMDVEGAETQVIEGSINTLTRYKPKLFIEYHPCIIGLKQAISSINMLESLGYKKGFLSDRVFDQPWIPRWVRRIRSWRGEISSILKQIENEEMGVFTVIVSV